ncbi:hypothetical protein GDO78_018105 [Eleutherodactylus coqui]|uniref:Uncharacterized protein n=1 Tax=Eleutherodactylus coqui TaxID=57060 RepID=A0A8J6JYD4_ELECQ|nr:hypothetical protein GDO78_018105 [Eleutherodactylus coqui]
MCTAGKVGVAIVRLYKFQHREFPTYVEFLKSHDHNLYTLIYSRTCHQITPLTSAGAALVIHFYHWSKGSSGPISSHAELRGPLE